MKNKHKTSIVKILESNELLSMASTSDTTPHINTAFFSYDNSLNLYYLSSKERVHVRNIKENSKVAVSIYNSHTTMSDNLAGLQILGLCKKAKGLDLIKGYTTYTKRFAKHTKGINKPEDFKKVWESEIFIIIPEYIKILDEEVFGAEVVETITIKDLDLN